MQESTSTPWRDLLPLVWGASWLTSIACEVVLLVIIATVVRRHRPDAYRPLMVWAIVSLAVGVVGQAAGFVSARTAGGIDSMMRAQALNGIVGTAFHVVLALLLVRGLIALAQPRKDTTVEGMPPYR